MFLTRQGLNPMSRLPLNASRAFKATTVSAG